MSDTEKNHLTDAQNAYATILSAAGQDHPITAQAQGILNSGGDPAAILAQLQGLQQNLSAAATQAAPSGTAASQPISNNQFYEGLEEKKQAAEDYLTKLLHEKVVVPAFAGDGEQKPLPSDTKVELLTGVNNGVSELEIHVKSAHMSVVGEKQMGDAVLEVLSSVPELNKNFNFSKPSDQPAESEDKRPRPSDFSWTQDKQSMGVKFSGQEAAPLVESIVALRDGRASPEEPVAQSQPAEKPAVAIPSELLKDTGTESGRKFNPDDFKKSEPVSLGNSAVERAANVPQDKQIAV